MNLNKNNNFVTSVLLFAITFQVVSIVIIITPSIRQQQQIQTARAITSSATATAAATSSASTSSSTTTTTNPTKTFNLVFDGKIFPIKYQITGIGGNNKLNSITVKESINKDKTQKIATALTVNIVAVSNGKLIIALPTALIDSPITFSVFEDNKFTQQVKEITRFSNLVQQQQIHILSIDFNKGTKQIEIDNVSNTGLHFKVNNSTAAAYHYYGKSNNYYCYCQIEQQ
jgi:hypothetical protein